MIFVLARIPLMVVQVYWRTHTPPTGSSIAGDLHLDNAENWRCTPSGGGTFDIGIVTLHEIGHSLGLGHEPRPSDGGNSAVMNPTYNSGITDLLPDDINGITLIYGIRSMSSGLVSDPFPVLASTNLVMYTIYLHNTGGTSLTNVQITNTIPYSTTYFPGSASDGGFESSSGVLTWPVNHNRRKLKCRPKLPGKCHRNHYRR